MKSFQFKPAWRAIGACANNAPVWFLQAECDGIAKVWGDDEVPYCMIEGRIKAEEGDWIIQEDDGKLRVWSPRRCSDVFRTLRGE